MQIYLNVNKCKFHAILHIILFFTSPACPHGTAGQWRTGVTYQGLPHKEMIQPIIEMTLPLSPREILLAEQFATKPLNSTVVMVFIDIIVFLLFREKNTFFSVLGLPDQWIIKENEVFLFSTPSEGSAGATEGTHHHILPTLCYLSQPFPLPASCFWTRPKVHHVCSTRLVLFSTAKENHPPPWLKFRLIRTPPVPALWWLKAWRSLQRWHLSAWVIKRH